MPPCACLLSGPAFRSCISPSQRAAVSLLFSQRAHLVPVRDYLLTQRRTNTRFTRAQHTHCTATLLGGHVGFSERASFPLDTPQKLYHRSCRAQIGRQRGTAHFDARLHHISRTFLPHAPPETGEVACTSDYWRPPTPSWSQMSRRQPWRWRPSQRRPLPPAVGPSTPSTPGCCYRSARPGSSAAGRAG